MIRKSEQIDQLIVALRKARAEFPTIGKEKTVTGAKFSYDYAPIEHIQEVVHPILDKHELTYSQMVGESDKGPTLTTLIAHISGQYMESTAPVMVGSNADSQDFGGALSYQKRYSLVAALGLILTNEDDDGLKASGKTGTITQKPKNHAPPPKLPVGDIPEDEMVSNDIGEYAIKFGKHSGKKLKSINPQDLMNYMSWIEKNSKSDNKPLSPLAAEFIDFANAYLKENR